MKEEHHGSLYLQRFVELPMSTGYAVSGTVPNPWPTKTIRQLSFDGGRTWHNERFVAATLRGRSSKVDAVIES